MKGTEISKSKAKYKYGRRRSRSLGGIISTEICKTIDRSLLPAERLKLLVEHSLRNALSISERKLSSNIDPDLFNNETSECLNRIDNSLKEQDLYNLATSGSESVLQGSLVDYLSQYNEAVLKLENETNEWENLLSSEKNNLEAVEAKESSPRTFKSSVDCSKYEKMDYSEILEDISYIAGNYDFKVQKLNVYVEKLNVCTILAEQYKSYLNKEADRYFSQMTGTPRTLIKKFHSKK